MTEPKGYRGIEVVAEASMIEKWRKQAIAGQPGFGTFAFVADEGSYMPGGEGTAPTPLTYFVAGAALCLLSHLTEIAANQKLVLRNPSVKATAKFHEQGSVLQGSKEGACDGFAISIQIDSDEPQEEIAALMRMARHVCFAMDALSSQVPLTFDNTLNDEHVDT